MVSGCLAVAVEVEDLGRGAAAHVVAVVAAAGVVVDQPGVDLSLEVADRAEPAAMERGAPALLEGGALEAFTHGVVVRGSWRDAVMCQAFGGQSGGEGSGDVFGAVIGQHSLHGDSVAPVAADGGLDEAGGDWAVGGAQGYHPVRPACGGVDGGELVHLADAFEVADVEAVEGDEVAGPGGEVAEPEGLVVCDRLSDHPRGVCCDGCSSGHALVPAAQAVTDQDLLNGRLGDLMATIGETI